MAARPPRGSQGYSPRPPRGAGGKPSGRPGPWRPGSEGPVMLYGLHTVEAALANPRRVPLRLVATRNALARLEERLPGGLSIAPEVVEPREIDRQLPADAVHQGLLLFAEPLEGVDIADVASARLLIALDQLTDPHNVGAVMRSAVALGAGGLVTTTRHAARESGALAKAASGAADLLPHATVTNLSRALEELRGEGFTVLGLDSAGDGDLETVPIGDKVVLVMGSEGKGIRPGVRQVVDAVVRLEVPGPLASLNVSNAAAIALYVTGRRLGLAAAG